MSTEEPPRQQLPEPGPDYRELERKIARWCRRQPDILAVIVIGSRARTQPPADRHSDLDLIVMSTNPEKYAGSTGWLGQFGELWIAALNTIGRGDREWLALYEDGLKADFLLVHAEPGQSVARMLEQLPYQDVLAHGHRILYTAGHVPASPAFAPRRPEGPELPSEPEFQRLVNSMLFAVERSAKFLERRELWRALMADGGAPSGYLLTLIEWHARATNVSDSDIWYEGRFMADWADPRVVATLEAMATGDSGVDRRSRLLAMLALAHWLAMEVATGLGYAYPSAGQQATFEWLMKRLRA